MTYKKTFVISTLEKSSYKSKYQNPLSFQGTRNLLDFRLNFSGILRYLRKTLNALPIIHFLMFKFHRREAEIFANNTKRIFEFRILMYDLSFRGTRNLLNCGLNFRGLQQYLGEPLNVLPILHFLMFKFYH
jgi:hypothetical protein